MRSCQFPGSGLELLHLIGPTTPMLSRGQGWQQEVADCVDFGGVTIDAHGTSVPNVQHLRWIYQALWQFHVKLKDQLLYNSFTVANLQPFKLMQIYVYLKHVRIAKWTGYDFGLARGWSLLESWVTTFLPDWQPPLIFDWFTSKSHEYYPHY